MSRAVVMDDDSQVRQHSNMLNVALRHCKIGKVVRKAKPYDGFALPREWYPYPDTNPVQVRWSDVGL